MQSNKFLWIKFHDVGIWQFATTFQFLFFPQNYSWDLKNLNSNIHSEKIYMQYYNGKISFSQNEEKYVLKINKLRKIRQKNFVWSALIRAYDALISAYNALNSACNALISAYNELIAAYAH